LDETFIYLADYLDRNYAVTSKARNALIYPAFVIFTFIAVMILMLTLVIPKISGILTSAGQEVPLYTRIVIGISSFVVDYGVFLLIALIILGFFAFYYMRQPAGKEAWARTQLNIPYVGSLYRKL